MSTPEDRAAQPHPDELVLAALAMGDHEDVEAAASAHVGRCAACTDEVASLREVLDLLGQTRTETLLAPPPAVWEAVVAEIDRAGALVSAAEPASEPRTAAVEQTSAAPVPLARRQVPTWWLAVAAGVALLAGIGLGAAWTPEQETNVPAAQVLGSTTLASLADDPQERGTAEVRQHDDQVSLHVAASDLGGPDGTREVWLINLDGTRMVSLGMMPSGEAGDFAFPKRLLEQGYRIVDVSFEPDDGDPTHSGTSLARGTIEG